MDPQGFEKEIDELRTGKSRLQNELEQVNQQLYRSRNQQRSQPDDDGDSEIERK